MMEHMDAGGGGSRAHAAAAQPRRASAAQAYPPLHARDDVNMDARQWWAEREARAEKEMATAMHKRMAAQRVQMHAFKTEQSKWERELQLRISKYAHDRKLLSEHNVELQKALASTEERYAGLQKEMDQQSAKLLEMEGDEREERINREQIRELRVENEKLQQRLIQWESFHDADVAAAVTRQEANQNELIDALEHKLEEVLKENARLRSIPWHRQPHRRRDGTVVCDGGGDDHLAEESPDACDQLHEDTTHYCQRVAELEKACKQKDQVILSLKGMLESHETISEEKMRMVRAKYDQTKAINIALQKKVLNCLTDGTGTPRNI